MWLERSEKSGRSFFVEAQSWKLCSTKIGHRHCEEQPVPKLRESNPLIKQNTSRIWGVLFIDSKSETFRSGLKVVNCTQCSNINDLLTK